MRIKPLALLLGVGLGMNTWAYESLPETQVRAPIYQNTIAKNPLYQKSVTSAQNRQSFITKWRFVSDHRTAV